MGVRFSDYICTVLQELYNRCVIISFSVLEIFRAKKGKEQYYVKWRDVPYNLSTWEYMDDPVNSQIRYSAETEI